MSDNHVDIHGLDKASVLAVLFNGTAPGGMGFFQSGNGPTVMTREQAQAIIDAGTSPDAGSTYRGRDLYYDYLYGRCLKVDLSGDSFDPWGYDRDNGDGAAQRLIDFLRETGEIDSEELHDQRRAKFLENCEETVVFANALCVESSPGIFELGGSDVAAPLLKLMDRETERFIAEA